MGGRGSSSAGGGTFSTSDYMNSLSRWTNQNENITPRDRQILESLIEERSQELGPVSYAYGMSRGMSMSDSELNALHEGGVFQEGKLSSWTGRIGQAQSFARNNVTDSKPNRVIIRTRSPINQAVRLAGLGFRNRFSEAETLVSSKASFIIDRIRQTNGYTEVWVTPNN